MTSTVKARKCGIQLSPPAVVLVYEDSESHKTRRRSMPVRNLRPGSSVSFAAQELKTRHAKYLDGVPKLTIERMLRILQEIMGGLNLDCAVKKVTPEFEVNSDEDLNKLGDEDLRRKKEMMDRKFSKERLKPGDEGFEYDKRVEFEAATKPSEWDSDGDENLEESSNDKVEVEKLEEDFWD